MRQKHRQEKKIYLTGRSQKKLVWIWWLLNSVLEYWQTITMQRGHQISNKYCLTKCLSDPDDIVKGLKFPLINKNRRNCKGSCSGKHCSNRSRSATEKNKIRVSIIFPLFNTQDEIAKLSKLEHILLGFTQVTPICIA